jgi:hypothetical protein
MPQNATASASIVGADDQAVVDAYNSSMQKANSVYGAMSAAEAVYRRQQRPFQDRAAIGGSVALIVSRAALAQDAASGSRKARRR